MAQNKRQKAIAAATQPGKAYPIDEALKILKDNSKAKFVEAIDVAVRFDAAGREVEVGVRDDGRGFEATTVASSARIRATAPGYP